MDYETKICLVEFITNPAWWSVIATIVAAVVAASITWTLGKRQNNLHKANIKLALYDKRYQIYEAIVKTKYISNSKNIVRWELDQEVGKSYVKTQLAEIHDEMYKASIVAHTVFPKPIALKIEQTYEQFNSVILEHLQITKALEEISPDDMHKVRDIGRKLIDKSSQNPLSEENINSTIDLMESFMVLTKYSPLKYKKRKEYEEWLFESNILGEIQPYITIDTLDK